MFIKCPTCKQEIEITNISNDDGSYLQPPDFDFDIKAECDCSEQWTDEINEQFNFDVKTAYDDKRYDGIDDCFDLLMTDNDYPEFSCKDLETEVDEVINA